MVWCQCRRRGVERGGSSLFTPEQIPEIRASTSAHLCTTLPAEGMDSGTQREERDTGGKAQREIHFVW